MNEKIIELRVHTERLDPPTDTKRLSAPAKAPRETWPARALLIDCETTIDERQSLTVGGYQYCRWKHGRYDAVEAGVFYDDALDAAGLLLLQRYAKAHGLRAWTRTAFVTRSSGARSAPRL